MHAERYIMDAIGYLKSPSRSPMQTRPVSVEAGSDDARIAALEHDVAKLRDALLVAGRQIDQLAANVGTAEDGL